MYEVKDSEQQPIYTTEPKTIIEFQIQRLRAEISNTEQPQQVINETSDAARIFRAVMEKHDEISLYESFYIMMLNRQNQVISIAKIGQGGITGAHVDIRIIFKHALLAVNCTTIILCHNHPSGNLRPSDSDIQLTEKIKRAGIILGINILDHIILSGTEEKYCSISF